MCDHSSRVNLSPEAKAKVCWSFVNWLFLQKPVKMLLKDPSWRREKIKIFPKNSTIADFFVCCSPKIMIWCCSQFLIFINSSDIEQVTTSSEYLWIHKTIAKLLWGNLGIIKMKIMQINNGKVEDSSPFGFLIGN